MAFVRLERKFREMLENNMEQLQQRQHVQSLRHRVHEPHRWPLPTLLGLDIFEFFAVPDPNNTSNLTDTYNHFRQVVDGYTVGVHIRNIRVGPSTSLPFDEAEKKRIRAYVTKIKEIIDGSSLEEGKKEALTTSLNAFLAELDNDRMPIRSSTMLSCRWPPRRRGG